MGMRVVESLVGAALMAAMVSGCASERDSSLPSDSPVFAQALEQARDNGADQSQIDILERVAQKGEVELSDVQDALAGTFKCLEAAGINYHEYTEEEAWGMSFIRYDMGVPIGGDVESAVEVSDECALRYSSFVEMLYGSQPRAVALLDGYRNDVVVPHYMACLDAAGVPYDNDATFEEIHDTAFFASVGEAGDPELKECVLSLNASY